jgi:copper(I)-binding protein
LFRTRCATCHTITGKEPENALGPDLLGVVQQRDMNWLLNWLRAPDQMLKAGDPIALALFDEYDRLPMPNMRLNQQEAMDLLDYIDEETQRLEGNTKLPASTSGEVLRISDAWVREAHPDAKANAGYMTLINTGPEEVTLVRVESDSFADIEVHEMVIVDGMMQMKKVADMTIPANGRVQLGPGGKHLMMTDPQTHLSTGQKVDMTLTFRSGRTQLLSVDVASR